MSLQEIVNNSNYVTDEDLQTNNILGMANTALGEVNAFCKTNLPFYKALQINEATYNAISDTWQLRLLEPYFSYSIAANDGDPNARNFHYDRFLQALRQFKESGLSSILTKDPGTGEATGFEGKSSKFRKIDVSEVTEHWGVW